MDEGSIRRAAEIVSDGGLVAYPTDTVYGLGCNPFNPTAVRKLVKAKRRLKGGLPVLVDCSERAKNLGSSIRLRSSLRTIFGRADSLSSCPRRWNFHPKYHPRD